MTLNQLVRDRILRAGPQMPTWQGRDRYINYQIANIAPATLLEYISDALEELQKPHDKRAWL